MVIDKKRQGRINRQNGKIFESLMRNDFIKDGNVVCRWLCNVSYKDKPEGELVQAMPHVFRGRIINAYTGFPDFFTFKPGSNKRLIGIECKRAKYLSKEEKMKCEWLVHNGIFDDILIAFPSKEKTGEVSYKRYFE